MNQWKAGILLPPRVSNGMGLQIFVSEMTSPAPIFPHPSLAVCHLASSFVGDGCMKTAILSFNLVFVAPSVLFGQNPL